MAFGALCLIAALALTFVAARGGFGPAPPTAAPARPPLAQGSGGGRETPNRPASSLAGR
jgi:hypothetical protein